MSTKIRPITHIITGTAPVNPWPPTGTYTICARLYTNTFLDHITLNTVSWNYDGGSSPTYSDANCTQYLSDLSSWNDSTANTVLQTTGQNEYGTYVDIFTDNSRSSESAVDFCVILGNDRVQTITDDSWKITRIEVFKVGMSNGIYRVNNNPSKGQWFRNRNDWTEFPLTPSSSTIFRPLSIFENIPEPPFPYQTIQIGNQIWMAETLKLDDGGEGIYTIDNCTINGVNYGTVYYYTCAAATRVAELVAGWHLPSKSEVDTLVQYVNNGSYNSTLCTKMKSTSGWSNNGTDDYGWNAKPLGMIDHGRESIGNEYTMWQSNNYRWYITNNNSTSNGNESDSYQYPIRLIKD